MIFARLDFSDRRFRLAFVAALLVLPLTTAWNLATADARPDWQIQVGPRLGGVVRILPLEWSWRALKAGDLQRAVTSRVTAAFPLRPILVRINNEIRFNLFGEITAPGIVRGRGGQFVDQFYIDAYCAITPTTAAERARSAIPLLRDLQDYYRARGAVFVYVLTPSKLAAMPETFRDDMKCAPETFRRRLSADYTALVRQAGIAVADTADLVYGLGGPQGQDMFPVGGVHWNALGLANAAREVAAEIDRQAGRTLLPPFDFSSVITNRAEGSDRELFDVFNVLFPPLGYPTPKVTYSQPVACATSQAATLDAAIVGSSFMHNLAETLIERACLAKLEMYFYLRQSRSGRSPYTILQTDLTTADLAPLREAKVMIVEENEAGLTYPESYVAELHKFIIGR